MVVLDCLPKLRRGLELAFGAHFLHDFPLKCSLLNILLIDQVLMSYLFFLMNAAKNSVTF